MRTVRKVTSEELQTNTAVIIKKFIESASREQKESLLDYVMDQVDAETIKLVIESNKRNFKDQAILLPLPPHLLLSADVSAKEEKNDIDRQINMRIK